MYRYANAYFVRAYMDISYVIYAYLCAFMRIYVFARVQGIYSYVNVSPFVDPVHMFIQYCTCIPVRLRANEPLTNFSDVNFV